MRYIVIFFIGFIVYAVLFLLDSKLAIKYSRNKHHEGIVISFYFGKGRLRFDHNVVLADNDKRQIKFFDYIKDNLTIFKRIADYLKRKKSKVELEIKILLGTGDAALTGILCGLLWAVAANILSYLAQYLKVTSEEITIAPDFEKSVFEADINCIFQTKLAHIIVVLIKIYYTRWLIKMEAKKSIGGEVSG
jgi:hypothetical protein